jgi:hypothetical protein
LLECKQSFETGFGGHRTCGDLRLGAQSQSDTSSYPWTLSTVAMAHFMRRPRLTSLSPSSENIHNAIFNQGNSPEWIRVWNQIKVAGQLAHSHHHFDYTIFLISGFLEELLEEPVCEIDENETVEAACEVRVFL